MTHPTIGFIGAGHMGKAMIEGLLNSEDNTFSATQIIASCKNHQHAENIANTFAIRSSTDNTQTIKQANYLVLAVKPQQMHDVLLEIAPLDLSEHIIISIAAGITIADYRKILGDEVTIIRAMPNMAASRQASLTGIYADGILQEKDEQLIDALFSAIGATAWLDDETQIDGITALSGSGIAYFFRLMQAMRKAGERYGFEENELYDIVNFTALGAATLTLESEESTDFNEWVSKIAVNGGTTEAAIKQFDTQHIDNMVENAMQAVVDRSKELSENLTKDW